MNYYPFHIGDYASATRHLSWDEDMAYRRLMDAYYTREEPIPLDRRQAYRLACATTEAQREAVDVVLAEFFEETPEGWRNGRCDAEIGAYKTKSAKASQSAHARWSNANAKQAQSESTASALDDVCERMPDQCDGNAPKTNTNISIPTGIERPGKRPSRKCPDSFEVTPAMRDWAEINAPLVNLDQATATFRDHTFKTAMSDWTGAWRNWMRREQQYTTERSKPRANGRADLIAGAAAAIFEDATHV